MLKVLRKQQKEPLIKVEQDLDTEKRPPLELSCTENTNGSTSPVSQDLPSPSSGTIRSSSSINQAFEDNPPSPTVSSPQFDNASLLSNDLDGESIGSPSIQADTVSHDLGPLETIHEEDATGGASSVAPDATNEWQLLSALRAGYTQSDFEIASPNTTITTLNSVQSASVPHVQNVSFDPVPQMITSPTSHDTEEYCAFCRAQEAGLLDPAVLLSRQNSVFGSNCSCGSSRWASSYTAVQPPLDSKQAAAAARGRQKRMGVRHRESHSEQKYHEEVRSHHKKTRQRHFTDPVDFEGILNIIGGFSWWQASVYALICLQQIPHAMFNLAIIFFMFTPKHHCLIPEIDPSETAGKPVHHDWQNLTNVMTLSLPQSSSGSFSQCEMYNLKYSRYTSMSFSAAMEDRASTDNHTVPCESWWYNHTVMTRTIVTEWDLVCSESMKRAHAHLAYALGYLAGCAVSGLSSDRFGRKPTIIGYGMLASLLGLILPYSTYFPVFLFVRFLSAVCNEAADLAAYVLCMEITATKYRGLVGSLVQTPWAMGYICLVAVAYVVRDWQKIQIITAALHTMSIFLICFLPESPRWLVVNSRVREAELIIRKACRYNNKTLPPDLELIAHAERRQWVKQTERTSLLHILKSRELTLRTARLLAVWAITALVYYGLAISLSELSGIDLFAVNALAGGIELPVLLICVFVLAIGRRRTLTASLILAGAMMLTVVLLPKGSSWLLLTFMLLGKAAAQAAFNTLYIFSTELYPTVIRNSVVGLASMVARLGSGLSGYVALLPAVTDNRVPMIIFGALSFVGAVLVVFFPETLGRPLPDTLQDAVEIQLPSSRNVSTASAPAGSGEVGGGTGGDSAMEYNFVITTTGSDETAMPDKATSHRKPV